MTKLIPNSIIGDTEAREEVYREMSSVYSVIFTDRIVWFDAICIHSVQNAYKAIKRTATNFEVSGDYT